MKNLKRIIFSLIVGTTALSGISAHAGWGVLGGANLYNLSDSNLDTKANVVAGLAFDGYVSEGFGLELDALYARNETNAFSYSSVQVPVQLRFQLIPVLNIGVGGYYAYATDEFIGHKRSDAGAVGSVRLNLPLSQVNLFVEGRYLYGLMDQFDVGDAKTRAIQALLGVVVKM